jgi:hypothetical protein
VENFGQHFRILVFRSKIPLWVKLLYTIWVAALVADHWRSSPLTLLWFCNLALLTTLAALWLENSLLASMQAVAIVYWMFLWNLDFLIHIVAGIRTVGVPLGMSNYMFDEKLSGFSRGLSLYHAWLPFFLLWVLVRIGYDRRARLAQTIFAWAVLFVSFALTKDPRGPAGNVNQVYGLSETGPQTWIAPWLWLTLVMVAWPASVYVPSHLLFSRIFRPPKG